jgi:putrescine transport system substrate-binding protein
LCSLCTHHKKEVFDKRLYIYDWFGVLSPELLKQFQDETGIHVLCDYYDHNGILEAKILAGQSGYDLVFPSLYPYVKRQIKAGAYQKINKKLLKNYKNLDPFILEIAQTIDPLLDYILPYYWGALGFAFDESIIRALYPEAPQDSWGMLFDPDIVSKFSSYGVSLLEEPVDVLPTLCAFLKLFDDPVQSKEVMQRLSLHLKKIQPYIRRFSSGRFMNDLLSGEICLAQVWSGEANKAIREAQSLGKKLRFVIPKEGSQLWVDCIAIPKDAPHPYYAHQFIDFLLRPDISASITNQTLLATSVLESRSYIHEDIRNDCNIFPSEHTKKQFFIPEDSSSLHDELLKKVWRAFRFL